MNDEECLCVVIVSMVVEVNNFCGCLCYGAVVLRLYIERFTCDNISCS